MIGVFVPNCMMSQAAFIRTRRVGWPLVAPKTMPVELLIWMTADAGHENS